MSSTPSSGRLIIVRHGESEWNARGVWTGSTDVHLSSKGFTEAKMLGEVLKDTRIDYAYCSQQVRALETLEGILDASEQYDVPYDRSSAINERDYGEYTGKNKWQVQQKVGKAEFSSIRRGWNHPVPGGETLKQVYQRAVPFYQNQVVPKLIDGQSVLLVAHGNSIRSLMKYIEDISDKGIEKTEMIFGEILIYQVDDKGKKVKKQVKKIDTTPPPA